MCQRHIANCWICGTTSEYGGGGGYVPPLSQCRTTPGAKLCQGWSRNSRYPNNRFSCLLALIGLAFRVTWLCWNCMRWKCRKYAGGKSRITFRWSKSCTVIRFHVFTTIRKLTPSGSAYGIFSSCVYFCNVGTDISVKVLSATRVVCAVWCRLS